MTLSTDSTGTGRPQGGDEGVEQCGACGKFIEIENEANIVTTALGVVVHTFCTPYAPSIHCYPQASGDKRLGAVGVVQDTENTSTQGNPT